MPRALFRMRGSSLHRTENTGPSPGTNEGDNMSNEVETFLNTWENESKATIAMLKALPEGQYDFRPDAGGRSLGELAWHLAEIDGYSGFGIERGKFEMGVKPDGLERPRTIEALAPGYERVHADARARLAKLVPA